MLSGTTGCRGARFAGGHPVSRPIVSKHIMQRINQALDADAKHTYVHDANPTLNTNVIITRKTDEAKPDGTPSIEVLMVEDGQEIILSPDGNVLQASFESNAKRKPLPLERAVQIIQDLAQRLFPIKPKES